MSSRGLLLGSFGLPVEFRKDEITFKAELSEVAPKRCAPKIMTLFIRFPARLSLLERLVNLTLVYYLTASTGIPAPDKLADEQIDNQRLLFTWGQESSVQNKRSCEPRPRRSVIH